MIYFIEHDTAENICHVCCDPMASIVPLVNRVLFSDKDGPMKDASGNYLSPYGLPLVDPVGIDAATYNALMTEGMKNYTYDQTTKTVVKRAPTTNATPTS